MTDHTLPRLPLIKDCRLIRTDDTWELAGFSGDHVVLQLSAGAGDTTAIREMLEALTDRLVLQERQPRPAAAGRLDLAGLVTRRRPGSDI